MKKAPIPYIDRKDEHRVKEMNRGKVGQRKKWTEEKFSYKNYYSTEGTARPCS